MPQNSQEWTFQQIHPKVRPYNTPEWKLVYATEQAQQQIYNSMAEKEKTQCVAMAHLNAVVESKRAVHKQMPRNFTELGPTIP